MVTDEAKDGHAEHIPAQSILGLVLGVVSGVIYPGLMLLLLFPTFVIPGLIALALQISPRTRSLAVGFGAASVGWLAYSIAFFVFVTVAGALQ